MTYRPKSCSTGWFVPSSSSPRRCCTPTPSTSSWRWVSRRGALCTGVCRRRLVVLSDGGWIRPCAWSRVLRQLRVLWLAGEWIDLDFPAARVDGEVRSMVGGARGVSPADVLSSAFLSRPSRRVATAAPFKASMRWGSSRSEVALEPSSSAAAGDGSTTAVAGGFWFLRISHGPETFL